MYTEGCGQQHEAAKAARKAGRKGGRTGGGKAGGQPTGEQPDGHCFLSREGGLPHAWRALDDVHEWLELHPGSARGRSAPRLRSISRRIAPGVLCVLPVLLAEAAAASVRRMHPAYAVAALFIAFNSLVRLGLPSSYCPRSQARAGPLASPLTARTLATGAELFFYHAEAVALGLDFWPLAPLAILTYLGETLCWSHLLLQSELLGAIEDSTWTAYQLLALLTSANPLKYVVCLPYVMNAMLGGHLRRQFSRATPPYFGAFWRAPPAVGVVPDEGVLAWSTPSLLAKPVTYALLRLASEEGELLDAWMLWWGVLPGLVLLLLVAVRWEKSLGASA